MKLVSCVTNIFKKGKNVYGDPATTMTTRNSASHAQYPITVSMDEYRFLSSASHHSIYKLSVLSKQHPITIDQHPITLSVDEQPHRCIYR